MSAASRRAPGEVFSHMLLLAQMLETPAPPRPPYPHEVWLTVNVSDVDRSLHDIAYEFEGRPVEIIGPMLQGSAAQPELSA